MRIESIEQTKSPLGKLRLRFGDETSLLVLPSVAAEHGLSVGMELSEEGFQSLRGRNAEALAKERALRIISASPVTKKALYRRLVEKGETEENAAAAVSWLTELRLLDDRQVAESVVRSGAAKGYGAARIRQMLYEKRVPKELWDEALEQLPPREAAIDDFLRRRFRGKTPDRAECKRATEALLRRGHTLSDIRSALERYAPEEDFFDD